jgi:hypothetical protein
MPAAQQSGTVSAFSSESAFVSAQRMARALTSSTLVPESYRGEGNLGNALIALELSHRIGASVMAVMQSMTPIHGRPSWSAAFLIATVNTCGRFSPLRFKWEGQQGNDNWGCRAYATERASKEELVGSLITISLAKAEGWYGKNGSKWRTMPEQMLMYRAASFWTRAYAPELSLGMMTQEEAEDISPVRASIVPVKEPEQAPHTTATQEPQPQPEPARTRVGRPRKTAAPVIEAEEVPATDKGATTTAEPTPEPTPEPEPAAATQPEPGPEPDPAPENEPGAGAVLSPEQQQVHTFVAECGRTFVEFRDAMAAVGWFPGCKSWESFADISPEVCGRLLRAKHGVRMQLEKGGAK